VLAGAALAVAGSLCSGAIADPDDYVFKPVQAEINTSMVATTAVRLIHKATKEPIIGAVIVESRLYMPAEPGASPPNAFRDRAAVSILTWHIPLQGASHDGGTLALVHRSEGPRRARARSGRDHLSSDTLMACCPMKVLFMGSSTSPRLVLIQ
jgi:hypothetical protein